MSILGWIAFTVAGLTVLCITVGAIVSLIAAYRFPRILQKKTAAPWKQHQAVIDQEKQWFAAQNPEQVEIQSFDGLKLRGRYLPLEGSKRAILLMHGYRAQSGEDDFAPVLRFYRDQGLNVLVVDQRAHGSSEGKAICFGVKERVDCKRWLEWLEERIKPEDLYLAGLSMGAATVLMATALTLPQSLHGVIADCGYSSPFEICAHVIQKSFHLPIKPFLPLARMVLKMVAGYDIRECSALAAMQQNHTIPVLFIHGELDMFVPMAMGHENYEACQAEKKLLLVPSAAHALSIWEDSATVKAELAVFLKKYASVR